ncbi:TadE/TadG family type IV pilus assembly protein [Tropicimonas isoalkanivorans]|uniref:Putative Flp pilus-assembly TadE/G-like n=1 Tax=Tropicimonas isoalkanivorans TaxID=441112 RepID=A0A1I1GDE3_9RHOB|nr:Tad domain-containing protein [Tropicimonas isoalkanivorans]SFC07888.1 Putative Flp pilus-assembly TadE/G-like [Tropicimonas isoalkanivorans]
MTPLRTIRDLRKAEEGTILVFWAMCLGMFLGIVALSFDLGRVGITQTELQAYADNVALAAAGELDGRDDSIIRARAAAATLITDWQSFGSEGNVLAGSDDYTLTFFRTLPDNDTDALTDVTTDPRKAAYVRATATANTVDMTFAAAFAGLTGHEDRDVVVNASAVAGFTQYACDITPLMFCLPNADYTADAHIGDMILLRSGGNGAAWGPGDFGFLDPAKIKVDPNGPCAGLNGQKLDSCLMGAIGSITQCFAQNGVDIEPGQKVGIEDAMFNVRFDIFKATMNGAKNDPDYAPAPNVIKGIVPKNGNGACIGNSEEASPDTVGLPRDTCFASGTCTRFGDGNWSRTEYVAKNYGGVDPHPSATTRFAYYKAEIAAAEARGAGSDILSGLSETGRPQCSNQMAASANRRVVVAAGIDCTTYGIGGAAKGVPVEEFFEIFLTEPVGDDGNSPPTLDLWGEIVGSASNDGGGSATTASFRDVVQLYR